MRSKWVKNFWTLEQLRGIKFTRARMPLNAVDTRMRFITLVDAAQQVLMIRVWTGFRRQNEEYSERSQSLRQCLGKQTCSGL